MKYYSLYKLLMFFKHQSKTKFETIKKIVYAIDSDLSDDETRDYIYKNLRAAGMTEEGYGQEEADNSTPDIVMHPGTGEYLVVTDEFKIRIEDRVYNITVYLN